MRKFSVNRHNAIAAIHEITRAIYAFMEPGTDCKVQVSQDNDRTPEQNKKMWAMLGDVSRQVKWRVDNNYIYMTPDDWKDVLTAGLKKHAKLAQGIDGGVVMLGCRTSKMSTKELAELIEFIYWFGSENSVKWTEAQKYLGG